VFSQLTLYWIIYVFSISNYKKNNVDIFYFAYINFTLTGTDKKLLLQKQFLPSNNIVSY